MLRLVMPRIAPGYTVDYLFQVRPDQSAANWLGWGDAPGTVSRRSHSGWGNSAQPIADRASFNPAFWIARSSPSAHCAHPGSQLRLRCVDAVRPVRERGAWPFRRLPRTSRDVSSNVLPIRFQAFPHRYLFSVYSVFYYRLWMRRRRRIQMLVEPNDFPKS